MQAFVSLARGWVFHGRTVSAEGQTEDSFGFGAPGPLTQFSQLCPHDMKTDVDHPPFKTSMCSYQASMGQALGQMLMPSTGQHLDYVIQHTFLAGGHWVTTDWRGGTHRLS